MFLGIASLLVTAWFFLPRGILPKMFGWFLALFFFRKIAKVFLYGLMAVFIAAAMTLGSGRTLQLFREMGHEIAVTF